jgi:hypothetical protein
VYLNWYPLKIQMDLLDHGHLLDLPHRPLRIYRKTIKSQLTIRAFIISNNCNNYYVINLGRSIKLKKFRYYDGSPSITSCFSPNFLIVFSNPGSIFISSNLYFYLDLLVVWKLNFELYTLQRLFHLLPRNYTNILEVLTD